MSENEMSTTVVNQIEGFTEDGMAAGDPAEAGRAYSGHGDLREQEELDYAWLQIHQFATNEGHEHGWYVPKLELPMDKWAEAHKGPRDVEDARFVICRRLTNEKRWERNATSSVISSVSLDLDDTPGWPQDKNHPHALNIVFFEIAPGTALYSKGWQEGDTPVPESVKREPARRAMAVAFQPELADGCGETGIQVARNPIPSKKRPGMYYCNEQFLDGWLGIVRFYPSLQLAYEDAEELRNAVKLVGRPPKLSDEEDRARQVVYENDEATDKDAKEFVPRNVAPF